MYCIRCGAELPEMAAYCPKCRQTVGELPVGCNFAGFWKRLAASLLDGAILGIVQSLLAIIGGMILGFSFEMWVAEESNGFFQMVPVIGSVFAGLGLVSLVATWLYYALFESSELQATPGKLVLGILVTDEAGNRINFGRASARYFGKIISALILMIGYMMAGFTEKKQALHDIIAATLVVNKR